MDEMLDNLGEFFAEKYIEVTAALSRIQLQESYPIDMNGNIVSGKLTATPNSPYSFILLCYITEELANMIADKMSNGMIGSIDERDLYLREYINIASGKAITSINNAIHKSIKFSVPEVQNTRYEHKDLEIYDNYVNTFLRCEYGCMMIEIAFSKYNINIVKSV
ncbi:MAG TPA: hypothetical protein VHQ24_02790 [Lachnospiraceae bacterium]|nr:hypothetical protein [Lachnospiraceae bacterium]